MLRPSRAKFPAKTVLAAVALAIIAEVAISCRSVGKVNVIQAPPAATVRPADGVATSTAHLDPIARYGGHVLTATGMPHARGNAYLWAKNIGTLVAYETFLRRYSDGDNAAFFRAEIRKKFLPKEKDWHEAWLLYSKMEIIEGAICDPNEGFILLGRPGSGKLAPFFYEDLITALKCSLSKEKVGVTMNRIFRARNTTPDDPREMPHESYETSVDFYSKKLWNTHLAYILFEGDRMLKSLGSGYDIFLREPIRSKIPGFRTETEMAAREPATRGAGTKDYGRVWIELTSVKINTTEKKNVAMFSDVQLAVRAESKHSPPIRFAEHLRTNYVAYGEEFPIFAEVERAARIVAISRWLADSYPEVAQKLVDTSYENAKVFVPQVIAARYEVTHKSPLGEQGLIGGVVFPNVNKTAMDEKAKVAETLLGDVVLKVLEARKGNETAWELPLGPKSNEKFVAWCVSAMKPGKSQAAIKGQEFHVAQSK